MISKKLRYIFTIFFICILYSSGFALMPDALKSLHIEKEYFPSQFKEVGKFGRITGKGKVVVLRRMVNRAFYAKEGDSIHEKDTIYTIGDCRARLEFKDGNLIIMSSDTSINVEKISFSAKKGKKSAFFRMWSGKIICYAVRLFRYPDMDLKLSTQTATIGVRGTKFGVELISGREARSYVPDGLIAGRGIYLAQVSPSAPITKVYGIEGELTVTSLVDGKSYLLKQNEVISAGPEGLGKAVFSPEAVRKFVEDIVQVIPPVSEKPEDITRERDIRTEEVEMMDQIDEM